MTDIKQISDKAGRLFKKYGIKSITMDDIASETGMSKKTLYQIVSDKDELIRIVFKEEFRDLKQTLINIMNKDYDAVKQLISYNRSICEFLANLSLGVNYDLRKYYLNFFEEIRADYLQLFNQIFVSNIRLGIKQNIYRKEINEEIIGKFHLNLIEQIPYSDIISIQEFTSESFTTEILIFQINGLANEKGRELLNNYIKNIKENNKPKEK